MLGLGVGLELFKLRLLLLRTSEEFGEGVECVDLAMEEGLGASCTEFRGDEGTETEFADRRQSNVSNKLIEYHRLQRSANFGINEFLK